jgi:hypothetical protein
VSVCIYLENSLKTFRANKDNPHKLLVNDATSLKSAPWVKDAPIKILIHGYTGHKDFSPNTEIRPGRYTNIYRTL